MGLDKAIRDVIRYHHEDETTARYIWVLRLRRGNGLPSFPFRG